MASSCSLGLGFCTYVCFMDQLKKLSFLCKLQSATSHALKLHLFWYIFDSIYTSIGSHKNGEVYPIYIVYM